MASSSSSIVTAKRVDSQPSLAFEGDDDDVSQQQCSPATAASDSEEEEQGAPRGDPSSSTAAAAAAASRGEGESSSSSFFRDVALLVTCFVTVPFVSMLIWIAFFAAAFYCANKQIRTALLVYLAYCFLDPSPRTGQRWFRQGTVEWFRNFSCFGAVAEYFPVTLVKTVDLSPDDSPYLFLYHPHGVISMGMGAALATNGCRFDRAFPGIVRHGVTLNASFLVPFLREWMLALGYVSADRETLARKLLPTAGGGRGESVVLVPGGAVEALHAAPDGFELVGHRRGYVRLALETGAQPVPCLGFGENRAFDSLNFPPQSSAYRWQRGMARVLSFSLPLLAHPLPRRRPIHVVVGGPVKFRKGTTVEEGHRQYMAAVQALYDEHKDKYGYRDIPLEWILSS